MLADVQVEIHRLLAWSHDAGISRQEIRLHHVMKRQIINEIAFRHLAFPLISTFG